LKVDGDFHDLDLDRGFTKGSDLMQIDPLLYNAEHEDSMATENMALGAKRAVTLRLEFRRV
jgi:hypothetical protein